MATANDPKPFSAQCKQYFGYKEGETLTEFMGELKAITPEDKAELSELLGKEGYPVAVKK